MYYKIFDIFFLQVAFQRKFQKDGGIQEYTPNMDNPETIGNDGL